MTTPTRRHRAGSWTPALRERFIQSLSTCGYVAHSAAVCGMSRQSAYRLRSRDAGFAAQWNEAVRKFHAGLEQETMIELAGSIEARMAAGTYDPLFFELLVEIAGEDLRDLVDPELLSPRDRNSCEAVSTAVH